MCWECECMHVCRVEMWDCPCSNTVWSPSPHTRHSHMHTHSSYTSLTHTCPLPSRRTSVVFCPSQSQCLQRERKGSGRASCSGGAPPEQDGRPMDEYQGPHEGVYMHTRTVLAPKDVSSCDACCGTFHFCLLLSVLLYHVRMQV